MPGPGQYSSEEREKLNKKSPSWSMGSSKRGSASALRNVPGPGAYDVPRKV